MEVEAIQFSDAPETVVKRPFDCIWLNLYRFDPSHGFENSTLQWIDWKLRGAVSRALLNSQVGELPLFLPTKGRLGTPYLVLWKNSEVLPEVFYTNCEGQHWKEVLYLCVSSANWDSVQKGLTVVEKSGAERSGAKIYLLKGFE